MKKIKFININWRILFSIAFIALMFLSINMMYTPGSGVAVDGRVDLSNADFKQDKLKALDGQWEFYWNRLLAPENFTDKPQPKVDSLVKVPGGWSDKGFGNEKYPEYGIATYRLILKYPSTIKDPALRIQRVCAAYKLYANGKLITEVGKVSNKLSDFEIGYEQLVVALPGDKQEIELIFQVANMAYARGGLRESPVFGSKQVLDTRKLFLLTQQLIFMGGVLIFGIYYLLLFFLQRKNITALLFSIICLLAALRASVWGETPLSILFQNLTFNQGVKITYFTGYNQMPIIIFFVINMYQMKYNKKILAAILLPNLIFEVFLLTPIHIISSTVVYHAILMMLQMLYTLVILIKAVICKRDNSILMLISVGIYILAIIADILCNLGLSKINLSYMFLYGNFVVIIAMSFIQAVQQSETYKKLVLYNEKLVEADGLKDKIMATEMSFLQAQIKPHFLYNALNAIANVCEKDGQKASKLIVDLAIYLRGSFEFNNLDKMLTIEKELEFVDTYFSIEQARFGQKIQLHKEIDIPLEYRLPVLIIQPLVENAVRHGISPKTLGGNIWIRIQKKNEDLHIEIEDDGVGIDSEKLANLLSEKDINKGVGLSNINYRLTRLYDKGLDISSEIGCGTSVRLIIPKGGK